MNKIHITPNLAIEYLKSKYENITPAIEINEQPNKIYFKTFIKDNRTTVTFYKNTGTIQTQPKNVEVEKLLEKFNKSKENSKDNLENYFRNRNNKNKSPPLIKPIESVIPPPEIYKKENVVQIDTEDEEIGYEDDEDEDEDEDEGTKAKPIKKKSSFKSVQGKSGVMSFFDHTKIDNRNKKNNNSRNENEIIDIDSDKETLPPPSPIHITSSYNRNSPPLNSLNNSNTIVTPKKTIDPDIDICDNNLYIPPIFNKYNNNTSTINIPLKRILKAYIAHGDNEKSQKFIKEILVKLNVEPVILQSEESKSYTIIEREMKNCDFGIVLITHERKVYEKMNDGSEIHREIAEPNLNLLLEMGLSLGYFGKHNTIIIEFFAHQYQIKLSNQMNIESGIFYYQSSDPNLIIDKIKNIISSINRRQ